MNIFGRQVSVAVILSALTSLGTLVLGVVTNIANNWSTTNPEGLILLISGGAMTLVTGALHIWDTMPANKTS